jgi:hypothetical protein
VLDLIDSETTMSEDRKTKTKTNTNTETERATAEDIARADLADHPASCSTDERQRPVAVTSTHEQRARAGMAQYAVTVRRPDGRETVVRVDAVDENDARSLVEYIVREQRAETEVILAAQETLPAGHITVDQP